MSPRDLRTFLIPVLVAAMALLGLAAASARGEVRGEVLVLCAGGGLVQVERDADGMPTGRSHLCPDLAPGLLAALGHPAPDGAAALAVVAADLPRQGAARLSGADGATPQARGPPVPA